MLAVSLDNDLPIGIRHFNEKIRELRLKPGVEVNLWLLGKSERARS